MAVPTVWLLYKFRDTVKQRTEACSSPPLPRKDTCRETNLSLFAAGPRRVLRHPHQSLRVHSVVSAPGLVDVAQAEVAELK